MRKHLIVPGWLIALAATTLCGCGGSSKDAQVRILNVSTGYSSLDMYINDGNSSSDTLQLQSAASGAVSDYTGFKSGTYTVKFRDAWRKRHAADPERSKARPMNPTPPTSRTGRAAILAP